MVTFILILIVFTVGYVLGANFGLGFINGKEKKERYEALSLFEKGDVISVYDFSHEYYSDSWLKSYEVIENIPSLNNIVLQESGYFSKEKRTYKYSNPHFKRIEVRNLHIILEKINK